ncbi:hypothetical protein [Solidesulfovibrio magneticus]|nr:hypothetical protein [Solidesulfovibrio magneticus]
MPACPSDPPRLRLVPKPEKKPRFARYIGIDYSGAEVPTSPLKGLRAYVADGDGPPREATTTEPGRKYWCRQALTDWLAQRLGEDIPTLVGIDHGFSFPLAYFEQYGLPDDWPAFLDDFAAHWPTDEPYMYVDFIRQGAFGDGAARMGSSRWRRLCEIRTGRAKSVFHFDVPGSVAKATFAGLTMLRRIRQETDGKAVFWPFDGFMPPAGASVVAEAYPSLVSHLYPRNGRTPDQHDAFCLCAWLQATDRAGRLSAFLEPSLSDAEREAVAIEGWILGLA